MKQKQAKKYFAQIVGAAALLLMGQAAMAYEPPIGIPDPGGADPKTGVSYGWGNLHPIDTTAPARPNTWNAGEVTGFYYINPDHSAATDSSNTYGHPSKPRRTVPATVPAGSYVELAGNYDTDDMPIRYRCTLSEPCWIRGATGDAKPNITGDFDLVDASYVFVENLEFNGGVGSAISIAGDSQNIAIRHNRVTNRSHPSGASTGIGARPGLGDVMENIIFYDNHFEGLGDLNVANDQDFHAMSLSMWGRGNSSGSELRNVWALDNFCTEISGDCLQVTGFPNAESYPRLHHLYIGDNTSFNNRQGGFGVKEASDVIISQNLSHSYDGDGPGNAGACFGYQYEKSNLWFLFNECHDSVFGIRQSDTGNGSLGEDVYMIGNLLYNIRPAADNTDYRPDHIWGQGVGIALWHGNLDRHIVDNTIFGTKAGLHANFRGGDVNFSGNIIADIGSDEGNTFFRLGLLSRTDGSNPKEHITMDNNLFFDADRQQYYSEQEGTRNMRSLDELKLDSTYCQESCLDTDPLFINPTLDPQTRDFRLQAGSPAIGANIKHPAYDRFEELYGLNIYKDFNGNDRHPTNPSLGAFEYQDGSNGGSDPFNPDNLEIKINYPTKGSVYTANADVAAIQFGGHASYEDETITVDWVLAQCASDCAQERANGGGDNPISGSTQTSRVVASGQNNWHVDNQALFPGRNILIINAVHPNGEKKVTSLIIEPEEEPINLDNLEVKINYPTKDSVYTPTGTITELSNFGGHASYEDETMTVNWVLAQCASDCAQERANGGGDNLISGSTQTSRVVESGQNNWHVGNHELFPGRNILIVTAVHPNGQEKVTSMIVEREVIPEPIDEQAPNLEILQTAVSLTGSVTDDMEVVSVDWWCVSVCVGSGRARISGNTWTIDGVNLNAGNNLIRLKASDAAGNTSRQDYAVTF